MNISTIALVAFITSSSTTTALLTNPRHISSFLLTHHRTPAAVLRSSTTTLHRDDDDDEEPKEPVEVAQVIDLESLTVPQLKEVYNTFEKMNEACTEDCTQTNEECDIVVKDERDVLMIQIQSILQERNQNKTLLKKNFVVDMDYMMVSDIVKTPWIYSLDQIKKTITSMESLNCQCTEEGNQTNDACDVQLKEERDDAIETLTLYLKSVKNLIVADDTATATATTTTTSHHTEDEDEKTTRKRKIVIVSEKAQQQQDRTTSVSSSSFFDMDEIRDCVIKNPGSKSLEVMQTMLLQLELQNNACTEDGTQTNAECDIDMKAERDSLMEALVSQIHDAKICLNQIKAFATTHNINQMAIDDVRKTVRNTIATTKKKKVSTTNEDYPTTTTTTTAFTASTDEFVIQI